MKRLVLFIAFLLCTSPTWAAVTVDSTFEKGFTTGVAKPRSFVSNAGTVTGTIGSNNNRALFCIVEVQQVSSLGTVSMTWNSVPMSLISSVTYRTTTNAIFLFGLLNPDTGNQTLSTDWTDPQTTVYSYIGCVSVYNVDQGTGWRNGATDSGVGTVASSTIASASGNMLIVGHGNNNGGADLAITAGTQAWRDISLSSNSLMGYIASTTGSSTVTATWTGSKEWGNVKVDVISSASTRRGQAPLVLP